MSRVEGQPKEGIRKVGKVSGYLASAALAFLGLSQFAHADSNYDKFLRDNPDVVWAQTQISDFNTEANRVFLELDRQGLNALGERFPNISAARLELQENEGKIPDPIDDKFDGMFKILGGLAVASLTHFFIVHYKKEEPLIDDQIELSS